MKNQNQFNEAQPSAVPSGKVTKDSLESAALPLCPVHQSLEDRDAAKKTAVQFKDVDQALDFAISKLPKKSQAAAEGLRSEALAQFKVNEQTRIAGELTTQTEELSKDWRQEIENTRSRRS